MNGWWAAFERRRTWVRDLDGWGERWLFFRALVFALAVPLQARCRWSWLDRAYQRRFSRSRAVAGPETWERTCRCVSTALRFGHPFVRGTCLVRGMTLYYFLRRAGHDVTLCFGGRRRAGVLVPEPGHCWLESQGLPIGEREDPRRDFVPLFRLPGASLGSPAMGKPGQVSNGGGP